ncbi:MAG: aspartyl protease family protein [Acidilobaceae archaeon]
MRDEEVLAKITLARGVESVNVTAIVDTGADVSVISRRLAEMLGSPIELEEVEETENS